MDPHALDALAERLPRGRVTDHHGEVATHARDRWALALLREARGARVPPPAAVVFPQTTEEVAVVLRWACDAGATIVPRAGASGLAGGAEAIKRSVVLDLHRLNRILDLDDLSQTVTVEAGVKGGDLERSLAAKGFTTGHDPESLEISTVGGWVATSSQGAASAGFGGASDLVLGLTAVLPGGEVLRLKPSPRPDTGPDLRRLLAGSEGTLAVITELTLAVSRAPALVWDGFRPHSFESGAALVREAVQRGFHPLVVNLLDDQEAGRMFGAFGHQGPVTLFGFDAAAPAIEARRFELRQLSRDLGGRPVDRELAEHWWDHRHDGVQWYEDVMGPDRALGRGVVADGMGVACLWRRLPLVYEQVRGALFDHAESVGCHLAHPYPTGASLNFSFVLRASTDGEVEDVYRDAWADATAACLDAGGSPAHHGVGLLKAPFLAEELGATGVDILRRVKAAFDPQWLLNPGKLVPRPEGL